MNGMHRDGIARRNEVRKRRFQILLRLEIADVLRIVGREVQSVQSSQNGIACPAPALGILEIGGGRHCHADNHHIVVLDYVRQRRVAVRSCSPAFLLQIIGSRLFKFFFNGSERILPQARLNILRGSGLMDLRLLDLRALTLERCLMRDEERPKC
jgi:hypothetical protein